MKFFLLKTFLLLNFIMIYTTAASFDSSILNDISSSKSEKNKKHKKRCLVPKEKARKILGDKIKIDKKIRFILGPCNPVIFVPGLFGTKLQMSIKCEEFKKKNNLYMEMRFNCGNTICKKNKNEEHVFWLSAINSPFKIKIDQSNKYNTCLAFFFKFYNSPNECPKLKGKRSSSICKHHDSVKILPYGASKKTYKKSRCGLNAINKIISTGQEFIDNIVNVGDSQGWETTTNLLLKEGYYPGFSIYGLPYDFRRFMFSNLNIIKFFNDAVNTLHKQTGKKVIVIGHSFGTNNSLKLINTINKQTRSKIKRFIANGPSFIGASKVLEFVTKGTSEFKTKLMGMTFNLSQLAQKLLVPFTPVTYELSPKNIFHSLSKNPKYQPFIQAITERIKDEVNLENKSNKQTIKGNNSLFHKFYPFIPSLEEKECNISNYKDKIKSLNKIMKKYHVNYLNYLPVYSPCRLRIYDLINCPLVSLSSNEFKSNTLKSIHELCNKANRKESYFTKSCKKCKNDIKSFYKNFAGNYIKDKTFNSLLKNSKFKYEVKKEANHIKKVVNEMYSYQKKNDKIKDAPAPKVPTTVIYSSFIDTRTAYLYKNNTNNFTKEEVFLYGGDGTVPTYSSLLPALKWIYEKNILNKTNIDVQIVEYCSLLHNKKKYKINYKDEKFLNRPYIHLGCGCLKKGKYDLNKMISKTPTCSHSSMINDPVLIELIFNISSKEKVAKDYDQISEEVHQALKKYDRKENYEKKCNKILYNANNS